MALALLALFLSSPWASAQEVPQPNPWKLVVPVSSPAASGQPALLRLSSDEALAVGRKLWQNEAGGTVKGLTHWNPGETFASLGIGHFIWYPLGMQGPFVESFPPMLSYLEKSGVDLPDWLRGGVPCPWDSRDEFYSQFGSRKMAQLRALLQETVALQAEFAAARLEHALPAMLSKTPPSRKAAVLAQLTRMANTRGGAYPLIDYVNFKGEGVSPTERYRGEGWGLLQVLERMRGTETGQAALDEFSKSAEALLRRRVRLSPPKRRERRWLPVWVKRVRSYRAAA